MEEETFAQALESLLNKHSMENESNTPDFILAGYLLSCLSAFNAGVVRRESWYGHQHRPGQSA